MSTHKPAVEPPRAIAKLPEAVVNRIAAGEIIQRPANALKELIENALDAGSTSIRITVKDGGLKLLQIQDNGSGIRKADLPILCERFTTSKIKAFEDLSQLGTYGFRGEALASITHVAHLSVTTKTREEACAWKAAYTDGVMIPFKAGAPSNEPIPCAGNDGTLIVVEDLFYNVSTRLKALRSASEEYSRIVAVVLQYSIHNAGVAMVCKKASSSNPEVNTPVGASVLDNIGLHYGETVKRELVELQVEDEGLGVKVKGWLSGPNYGAKRGTFLFFINHRLVNCSSLKQALEAFYGALLAKGSHPFVYLSLEIDPTKVDVNVHPTKSEVGFEDEDEVVKLVCDYLAEKLAKASDSRSFKVQTLLPGAPRPMDVAPTVASTSKATPSSVNVAQRKVAPKSMVRTDHNVQTLDSMFVPVPAPKISSSWKGKGRATVPDEDDEDEVMMVDDEGEDDDESVPSVMSKRRKVFKADKADEDDDEDDDESIVVAPPELQKATRVRIPQSETTLKSVRELRKEVLEKADSDLDAIIKGHIFVGVADLRTSLSMVQHHTKLYLVNHASLCEELFYQLGLRQFGRLARIKLKPPPPMRELIRLAVESDEAKAAAKMPTEDIIDHLYTTIYASRAMLEEYFAFSISDDGLIESLPLIVPCHTPNLIKLPLFLLRIGVSVDWDNEKPCFESVLREFAYFYVPGPSPPEFDANVASDPRQDDPYRPPPSGRTESEEKEEKRVLQHVLWPVARQYLLAPGSLKKKDVVQVTSLENLFKVFERC